MPKVLARVKMPAECSRIYVLPVYARSDLYMDSPLSSLSVSISNKILFLYYHLQKLLHTLWRMYRDLEMTVTLNPKLLSML